MNPIFAAACELETFCTKRSWEHAFIGALAVLRWGEPRLTHDVDLTILTGFGREAEFADALLASFVPRRADAREFALRFRVLLLRSSSATPVDISFAAMPFEERTMSRASIWAPVEGVALRTCSAEDLVVLKAFAGRDKDWLDIEGVVLRQRSSLDVGVILNELEPLLELKEAPESMVHLRRILDRVYRS